MATIIGGEGTGLLDTSFYLLNRNDSTREGAMGHGEVAFVNVSNGNLIIRHTDAILPSNGEDYALIRTYNSRGNWNTSVGKGWTLTSFLELSQITNNVIYLVNPDSSQFTFRYDSATGKYRSVDGAGAYEEIAYDKTSKTYVLNRSDQTRLFFDNVGNMVRSVDTNGNKIEYLRSSGKLVQIRDDNAHVINYIYSGSNLVRIEEATLGVLVRYTYDSGGRLLSSIDRSGDITSYSYYTDGSLAAVTLPYQQGEAVRTIRFTYDPDPTDSTGKTRLLRTIVDAEGNTTFFEYRFQLDNFSKYNGGTTWMLNALGYNRIQSNQAEYVAWRVANGYYATWDATRYANDPAYKAQAQEILLRHATTFTYGAKGEILSVTDQKGYRTSYLYDTSENLTAILDANGFAITTSDDLYWRELRREYGYVDPLTGQGKLVAQLTASELADLRLRYSTGFTYDARGNLTSRRDNAGNLTTYTYTSFNKLASETAALGHALIGSDDSLYQQKRLELGYAQYVADLTTADKAALLALYTTTYSYDSRQNLIEIRSPGGDLTRFEYDSFGNQTRRIVYLDRNDLTNPAKQQVTQYFYDAFGNNVKTVDAEGHISYATFDRFGNRLTFVDGRGGVTRYTYDNDHRLVTVIDPEGHTTVFTYDSVGNRIGVRDASGHAIIYVYDRNNMLIAVVDNAAADPAQNRRTEFRYDVIGNRTAIVDAEGRETRYVYREDNRLIEVITPEVRDPSGALTRYHTTYDYDAVGNRISVRDNNGNLTQYAYEQNNLLKQVTDAIGNVTQFRYDANLNQVSIVIGAQLAPELRRVLRLEYDQENQLIAEVDAEGNTTRYRYDAPGNRIAITDANGNTTDFEYDRNNRLVREIRPAVIDPRTGLSTRYTVTHQFDANGNTIATTDENGNTTRFTFDKDDRVVMIEDANGVKTVYTYDSRHNRTSVQIGVQASVNAAGTVVVGDTTNAQVVTYTYDEFNQIIAKIDGVGNALVSSDALLYQQMRSELGYAVRTADLSAADQNALRNLHTERYRYDRVGNRTALTDSQGRTTSSVYDGLNRLTERRDALGQTMSHAYDGNGNRVVQTDALGRQTRFAHDAVNRLTATTDALGVVTHRDYDHVGNLTALTRAHGTDEARTTRYVYDLNNRLLQEVDPENHRVGLYRYDAVGNRLEVIDARGGRTDYVYDALNRNVRVIDPLRFETRFEYDGVGNRLTLVDARGAITRFTYDPGNRLIEIRDAEQRTSLFTYDARDNRVTQTTAAGTPQAETTTYVYDAENNLREVIDAEGNRTTHGFDRVYNRISTTDGNGNTTRYAFDAVNRMIEVTDAENQKTTYAYDAVGNRLTRTDALGRVTRYIHDDRNQLIREIDANNVATEYRHDRVGNRTSIVRAAGTDEAQHTRFFYDQDDRLIATVDAIGNGLAESDATEYQARRTELGYPAAAAMLSDGQKAELRARHTTRNVYDENHNLTRSIDALGRVTGYEYDANNRVTRIIDPIGMGLAENDQAEYQARRLALGYPASIASLTPAQVEALKAIQSTRYAYDAIGNRVQVIDALGRAQTTYYNLNSEVVITVDAEGALSEFGYDANGNRIRETRYATRLTGPADPGQAPTPLVDLGRDETRYFGYDKLNRQVRSVDWEGAVVDTIYDAVGNIRATIGYARTINVNPALSLAVQTPPADPTQDQRIEFNYDRANRLVRRTDAEGFTTDYAYDAVGNRVRQTLYLDKTDFNTPARQQVTRYNHDALNRQTGMISATGIEIRHVFDAVGNRLETIEAFGSTDARRQFYVYDDLNRIVLETNPEGTATRHVYDAVGQMIEHIEAAGLPEARTTRNRFDGNGRLVERTYPDGTVTRNDYDAIGNLTGQTVAAGSVDARRTVFEYDRNNRLIRDTLAAGTAAAIVRTQTYDAFGNRVSEIIGANTPDGRHTLYAYDRNNRLITETDGNGIATQYAYDAFGNVLRRRVTGVTLGSDGNPIARTQDVVMDFDRRNQQISTRNGAGDRTTQVYDAAGNLLAQTRGAGTAAASTTEYRYDLDNRLIEKLVDPAGLALSTRYAYDQRNNLITETNARGFSMTTAYDLMNRALSTTDALGFTVAFTYDRYGNQTSITTGLYSGSDPAKAALAQPAITRFAYDSMNRQIFQVDALGVVTRFNHDARGNRVEKIDAYGRLAAGTAIVETNIIPIADTAARIHRTSYDAADRMVTETQPTGMVITYAYNGAGELAARTVDAGSGPEFKNATTRHFYDAGGRKIFEVDPIGAVTGFEYDDFDNVIRVTRGLALGVDGRPSTAATADMRVTQYVYDAANRLLRETVDPQSLKLTTRYEYDARGNQVAIIDGNGSRGESVYDAADRVIWQRDGEGNVMAFGYDARGNKTTETRYANSGAGLPVGALPPTDPADQVTRYQYDAQDRLTERTDPRGVVNRLRYDAVGNVIENSENVTAQYDGAIRTRRFVYNLANLVSEQTDANGLVTRFEYDSVYNLTRTTAINTWVDTLQAGEGAGTVRTEEQVTAYRYDLNNRLIDEIQDPNGLALHMSYRYDGLGNRIAEVDANGQAAIRDDSAWAQGVRRELGLVDAAGQVIPAASLTVAQKTQVLNAFTTRTWFDAAGRARFTVDPLGHVKEARYDAVGNLTLAIQFANPVNVSTLDDYSLPAISPNPAQDRSVEYGYDKANREIEVRLDPVRSFVNGQWIDDHRPTTRKAYDGVGNVVRETDANGFTTYGYYDSRGLMIGQIDGEGFLRINAFDAFGNAVQETLYLQRPALTDAQKNSLDVRTYSPAGETRVIERQYDLGNHEIETRYPAVDLFAIGGNEGTSALRVTRRFDAFGNVLTETVMHRIGNDTPAFKTMAYDAAGRLVLEVDARAEELILSDAAPFVAQRQELGIVNAAGKGKFVAELTDADRAVLRALYTTTYAYDAANNLRERLEGGRASTFEYDRANRNTRVHLPAASATEVDANGTILTVENQRVVAELGYDAAGNMIREFKSDGTEILYRYDAANRRVAAIDQNSVYTLYGYDFSGNRTVMHRYFTPIADRANLREPSATSRDQHIEYGYDRVGRLIQEFQLGAIEDSSDDRVIHFSYDANGNQVEIVDPRGHVSRMSYDGLNRVIGTVNPSGGLTVTGYDAMGNIVNRQAGGFDAPVLVGGRVQLALTTNEGVQVRWQTDHPTEGLVYVRAAGSLSAFRVFGQAGNYASAQEVAITGLDADTLYEYYIVSKDAFGYTLAGATQTFRTLPAITGAAVSGVRAEGAAFAAELSFALPPGALNVVVAVGTPGADGLSMAGETLFTPVIQSDGSYAVTLNFSDPATAAFQIRWSDGARSMASGVSPIQQSQSLRVFDGTLKGTPAAQGHDLTVTWDLSAALAAGAIRSYVDPSSGLRRYNVFVGFTSETGQDPLYLEAQLNAQGRFEVRFENLAERSRVLHFYYVSPAGLLVTAATQSVPSLAGLDARLQRIELDFPDVDTAGTTLQFQYRRVGDVAWNTLPASAVNGLSVNVNGVGEGDFEYQATLNAGTSVLRTSIGTFSLREPGELSSLVRHPVVNNVADGTRPGEPVRHVLENGVLTFPDLLPLGAGESLSFTITDASGVSTVYPFDTATFDLKTLAIGEYSMRAVKTLTVTTTTTDPDTGLPVTSTTTTVRADITASASVPAAGVSFTLNDNLVRFTGLTAPASGATFTLDVTNQAGVVTRYALTAAEFDLTVLDPGRYALRLVQSNATTTLADITGIIVVAPRTLTQASADTLSGVRRLTAFDLSAPADRAVETTVTGTAQSTDHVFSYFDGNGWKTFTNEQGGVWTRYFYDEQGRVTREVRFKRRDDAGVFLDAIRDPLTRPDLAVLLADYQAAVAGHNPAAGVDTIRVIERAYDAAGNKLIEDTVSQAYGRVRSEYRYDRFNNMTRETAFQGATDALGNSLELTTGYSYDAFNRVLTMTVGPFQFADDQGNGYYQSVTRRMAYDRFGHKTLDVDERGASQRFHYDGRGWLAREWSHAALAAGGSSNLRTDHAYDAVGRLVSKVNTDLTGRAAQPTHTTTVQYDNHDQVISYSVEGEETRFGYDTAGNKVSVTNARGHTESFEYDAENRVIARTDRLGFVSRKAYDAYGQVVSETDGAGRLTTYTVGAYGQVLEQTSRFTDGYARLSGASTMTETTTYDWLGRQVKVVDSFGKHMTYGYDDADRQRSVADLANNQSVAYTYDQQGNRIQEILTRAGSVLRTQTNSYNNRGWLVGVNTNAGVAFGGSTLNQPVDLDFRYDAAGNRVRVNGEAYRYDADNRMVLAYNGKDKQTVSAITYDGFGNRLSVTQPGGTVTYTYDARHRVLSSSSGESWQYDEVGNATHQRKANGDTTTTSFDAENRATTSVSTAAGKSTTSTTYYDGAGNVQSVNINGGDYGFNEVTYRDIAYRENAKRVENGWANGAAGLTGATTFTRNSNGELTFLDRGKSNIAAFTHDLEGHILSRSDKNAPGTDALYIEAFQQDPNTTYGQDDYGSYQSLAQIRLAGKLGSQNAVTHLRSFVYTTGKPVAEAATDHRLTQTQLTLTGGTAQYDAEGNPTAWTVTLQASDLAYQPDGSLDRQQTALNLAARLYTNFSALSTDGQNRVASHLATRLPADPDLTAGRTVPVDGYLLLNDGQYQNTTLTTDYFYRAIGEGTPLGQAATYTVRTGDTLTGIAAQYYGSPSYWYLIAEANHLSATAELKEGTTLTIPNRVANSINNAQTLGLYNENDIIGSTSPELITIPQPKKKKKWYQKLLQVIIIVIIIVAAIFTAGAALGALGLGAGALGTIGAAGAAFGAAAAGAVAGALGVASIGVLGGLALAATLGYAIGAVTSVATQGLAILGGLQEKFDWKGVRDMSKSFAISALAAGAGGWAANAVQGAGPAAQTGVRVGVEVASQMAQNDGKITNYSGVLLAFLPGAGSVANQTGAWAGAVRFVDAHRKAVGAGLAILEKRAKHQEVNALDWANVATAVLQGPAGTGQFLDSQKNIRWGEVAKQALIATAASLYVRRRMGEDAQLSFLGNQYGGLVQGIESEQGKYNDLQQKIKDGFLQQEDFNRLWSDPAMNPHERALALSGLAARNEQAARIKEARLRRAQETAAQPRPEASEADKRAWLRASFASADTGTMNDGPPVGAGVLSGVPDPEALLGPDVESSQQLVNRIRGQIRSNQPVSDEDYRQLMYTLRDRGYAVPRETFDRGFYTFPVEGEVTIARNSLVARSVNDFVARTEDQNEARFQFNLRTGFFTNFERVGNTEARYVDVTRYLGPAQGERTVRLYFQTDAAQLARENPNLSARITTDEALLNKMEIAPYEVTINAAFATRNASQVDISGAWRPPGGGPHTSGRGLDISRVNNVNIFNTQVGATQPEIVRQFSYNLRTAGASQVIQPWMIFGVSGLPLVNPARVAMGQGFIENRLTNLPGPPVNRLEWDHRHHLHITTGP